MSGRIQGTVGNDKQYGVQGSVSVPIIKDLLAIRVVGGCVHFGGSYHHDVTGQDAGGYAPRSTNSGTPT